MFNFNSIEEAIFDIKQGKMAVVVDDEDRENEGDLIVAAEKVTANHINFMATYGRGLICMPDRKSTRLNSSHANISYAVFCLIKKNVSTIHVPVTAPSLPTDQPGSDVAAVQSLAFFLLLSKVPIIHVDTKCDTGLAWFRDLIL